MQLLPGKVKGLLKHGQSSGQLAAIAQARVLAGRNTLGARRGTKMLQIPEESFEDVSSNLTPLAGIRMKKNSGKLITASKLAAQASGPELPPSLAQLKH